MPQLRTSVGAAASYRQMRCDPVRITYHSKIHSLQGTHPRSLFTWRSKSNDSDLDLYPKFHREKIIMASKKNTASKKKSKPDAISMLKADHAKVKNLFAQFESARADSRKLKIASSICQELTIHTKIEEEVFYPAAREALQDDDLLDEADVEHQSAKELIEQILAGGPGKDKWEAKVKVLGEYINHHVKEEETEMFPALRDTDLDLRQLAAELADRKAELKSNY